MRTIFAIVLILTAFAANAQRGTASKLRIGCFKYNGGGDWYANPTSLPNLARFCNQNMGMNLEVDNIPVEVGSSDLFNYAFVSMTGHGNVQFSDQEAENLRNYLLAGGFLHIDDNFGMDPYVRPALKRVFPEAELVELPFNHPIYHQKYNFPNGLPKVHEHDGTPPRGYGLVYQGRLVCFYSVECDLGDGWEDQSVHKDPEETRQKALQMGANIIRFVCQQ